MSSVQSPLLDLFDIADRGDDVIVDANTQTPQLVGQFTILVHRNAVIVGHLDVVERVVAGVRFSIEQPSNGVGFCCQLPPDMS